MHKQKRLVIFDYDKRKGGTGSQQNEQLTKNIGISNT